jgi:hypothetical protein
MNPSHHQPIFVLSSLWRPGSTLLQRFITATGEVLVWGETGGALNAIAEAACQKFIADPKDAHTGLWASSHSPLGVWERARLRYWLRDEIKQWGY